VVELTRVKGDLQSLRASTLIATGAVMLMVAIIGWIATHATIAVPAPTLPAIPLRNEPSDGRVERLRVEVLGAMPHDRAAFTQGLVWHAGVLYESTGLVGRSSLRQVDRANGEIRRELRVEPTVFAEGLARVGDRLIQITWKDGIAFVYDLASFERVGEHRYSGEGWGLCFDGQRLVMTDGSRNLTFRDPQTFAATGTLPVTLDGQPVERLNELECVGDRVYANVWMTEQIMRIDSRTGRVDAVIDASNLLSPEERQGVDVLNGIAYDADRDVFLITGKLWPRMFEVRFVPAGP
jgi:glutaminyl-peptide cyclotransferase